MKAIITFLKQPGRLKHHLLSTAILSLVASNIGYSMSIGNQTTTYTFRLSSKVISLTEPNDYSRDYPRPIHINQTLNIFDNVTYNDTDRSRVLHESYWDYGKIFPFSKVKGRLSFTVVLYRTFDEKIDLEKDAQFSKFMQNDFKNKYTKTEIEEYGVTPPGKYVLEDNNGSQWLYYEYDVDGQIRYCYSIPISDKHYIMANFRFIDNSIGQKSNWKGKAKSTMNQIMSSFKIE